MAKTSERHRAQRAKQYSRTLIFLEVSSYARLFK